MSVRFLDLTRYPRYEHFQYFQTMAYPYVGLTVQADVTALRQATQDSGSSFFLACLYCAARAANAIPELRQRVIDGGIAEFDHCDTSHTVALADGTYRYCQLDCRMAFPEFLRTGRARQQAAAAAEGLDAEADETALFFVSCIPWVTYTAITQPVPCPADSNPRITFGKYELRDGTYRMPLTLLAHHGLVDGLHISRFFEAFQQEAAGLAQALARP